MTAIKGDNFTGHQNEQIVGFGEVVIADDLDLERRNIEQGTNSVMIFLSCLLLLTFAFRFKKIEKADGNNNAIDNDEHEYANVH